MSGEPPVAPRDDEENARLLAAVMRDYNRMRDQKIRCEAEVERLEAELRAAREEAEREHGTSDLDRLREMLDRSRRENAEAVDAFEREVAEVQERLRAAEAALGGADAPGGAIAAAAVGAPAAARGAPTRFGRPVGAV